MQKEAGIEKTQVGDRKTILMIDRPTKKNRESIDLDATYKNIFNQINDESKDLERLHSQRNIAHDKFTKFFLDNAMKEKEERRRSSVNVLDRMRHSLAAGGNRNSMSQNYPSPIVIRKTLAPKQLDIVS